MKKIMLMIADPANRITLAAMLSREGYEIVTDSADVVVADLTEDAIQGAGSMPTLVLVTQSEVAAAVRAMKSGVYGYVLLPFVPGEVGIMVRRALAADGATPGIQEEQAMISLTKAESRHIVDTLRRCKHNKTEAARILGIGRNTLWRKLKSIEAGRRDVGKTGIT